MKKCTKCGELKSLTEFSKRTASKDGLTPRCRICDSARRKQHALNHIEAEREGQKRWRENNKDRKKATDKAGYEKNKEQRNKYGKDYYQKNKEATNKRNKEYAEKNKDRLKLKQAENRLKNLESIRAKRREHYRLNKHMYIANAAKRRADEKQATPQWADLEAIKEIYKESEMLSKSTGIRHHVDHIIPINNKLVCGLHVPYNMQILTWQENCKKSNNFSS